MLNSLFKSRAVVLAAVAASGTFAALAQHASAAAFTPGDVLVYRVGDGSAALSSAAATVFIDEYNGTGTLVQSIQMPTSSSGSGTFPLTAAGASTAEGFINFSTDGTLLTLTGYDATPGTASVAGTTSASVPRVVGVIPTSTGVPSVTTALTDFATGSSPRGAITVDDTNVYVDGGAGGVRYTAISASTSTQLSTTVTNLRTVNVAGGQLYVSDASGSTVRLGAVGSGLPTTSGQTITNLPGFLTSTGSPYAFVFADLDGNPGIDTLYVADDGAVTANGGIQKWSLVSGNWVLTGVIGGSVGNKGLSAYVSGSSVILYTSSPTGLYAFTDTSGYDALASGSTDILVASAGTNTAFRGDAIVPGAAPVAPVPEPASVGILAVAGLGLLARRRKA